MDVNMDTCKAEREWTWLETLRYKVFPVKYCELPEPDFKWDECFTHNLTIHVSFIDRIKLLFSGVLKTSSKTVCENPMGNHRTNSVSFVAWE